MNRHDRDDGGWEIGESSIDDIVEADPSEDGGGPENNRVRDHRRDGSDSSSVLSMQYQASDASEEEGWPEGLHDDDTCSARGSSYNNPTSSSAPDGTHDKYLRSFAIRRQRNVNQSGNSAGEMSSGSAGSSISIPNAQQSLRESSDAARASAGQALDREIEIASQGLEHMTVGSLPSYTPSFETTRESMDADEAEFLDNKLMADLANQAFLEWRVTSSETVQNDDDDDKTIRMYPRVSSPMNRAVSGLPASKSCRTFFAPLKNSNDTTEFILEGFGTEICIRRNELWQSESYSGTLMNISISTDDKCIVRANKTDLAVESEYFRAMLTHTEFSESSSSDVHIKNINGTALGTIISAIYERRIVIGRSNIEELLAVSSYLQFLTIREICIQYLKRRVYESECFHSMLLAEQHYCEGLFDFAVSYALRHFSECLRSDEENLVLLSQTTITSLIASDKLSVEEEADVIRAILLWVNHDLANRKNLFPGLLSLVRITYVEAEALADIVWKEPLIKESVEAMALISRALMYKLLPHREDVFSVLNRNERQYEPSKLMVIGGFNASHRYTGSFEVFDPVQNSWSESSDVHAARCSASAVVLDRNVYLLGGVMVGSNQREVERYSQATGWTTLASMSIPRCSHSSAVLKMSGKNCIFAIGGNNGGRGGDGHERTVEYFDPVANNWKFVCPMHCRRSDVGVAQLNGKIYAIGGEDSDRVLKSAEVYQPDLDEWKMIADMHSKRMAMGVVALRGKVYAIGGYDGENNLLDTVERYDPETNSWEMVAKLQYPRASFAVEILFGKIYVCGGLGGQQEVNGSPILKSVEVYVESMNRWIPVQDMSVPRHGLSVVAI